MITQFTEDIPKGCSTPDFERKPIPLTIQEGKTATFKAVPSGEPKPEVTWRRAKGDMDDPKKFKFTYDKALNEYCLQVIKANGDDADTYRCYASNEYGEAVCSVTLIIIEPLVSQPRSIPICRTGARVKQDKMSEEKMWELLMSADKKDYERICMEYGYTDFRGMLKKLTQMKKEREEEQAKYIDAISNLRHIQVNSEGSAEFEIEMELKDLNSRIFLYKDGVMIPFSTDMEMKHNLKRCGKKYIFSINSLMPEDAGLYQVDVEDTNVFSTDLPTKFIPVNFASPLKEVKCKERDDIMFECIITHPLPRLVWMYKNKPIEAGEKFQFAVSEDKLTHRMVVKDVMPVDKGIYSVAAGIRSSSAWLLVETEESVDPSIQGKKKPKKGQAIDINAGLMNQPVDGNLNNFLKSLGDGSGAGDGAGLGSGGQNSTDGLDGSGGLRKGGAGMGGEGGLGDGQGGQGGMGDGKGGLGGGKGLQSHEGMTICKDGSAHKLIFSNIQDSDAGKYRFEAEGHKTESHVIVADPPEIDMEELARLAKEPLVVKAGQNAAIKVPFGGRPPIKVSWKDFKVTDSTYSTLSLSWTKPSTDEGDEAKGYYVEVKPEDSDTWLRYNSSPTNTTSYTLKGLKSMQMYFVRVIAVNDGGLGEPKELDNYILAMPPPVRPYFHNESSLKSFMAVKAGNTIRVNINFEASPIPDVIWLKDGSSLSKRATITNADGLSQLLIPTSERSDSGVYTIMVKNYFGQECFSFEICVTDNIFNNKFTAVIVSGRQYHFRVFAKNDMGISTASDSPAWGIAKQKEKFTVKMPNYKQTDPRQAPKFTVRLKNHTVPRGYPCNMSCAVKGNPAPIVTWYRNNISIMENAQYYTSNICGVCSMLITNVSPKDSGEYSAIAENCMGRAECTTRLNITGNFTILTSYFTLKTTAMAKCFASPYRINTFCFIKSKETC
ncbi:UNVERIFIED_CONTAM: hypothetical protein FKN15_067712 [Acipenser sinensis]